MDLLRGDPAATERAQELESSGEVRGVTPPVAAELYVGAFRFGDEPFERVRRLLETLVWLPMDLEACEEAGRLGAELLARGEPVGAVDLFVAATSKRHGHALLTRDRAFARIPGLSVQTY